MSAPLILKTIGWVPVVWLVTVQLLVERGRLSRDGVALRIAGMAAAAVVIGAAATASMWPVAALGLLWLRTEVFAHRHPLHEFRAHREQARRERTEQENAEREQTTPDDADVDVEATPSADPPGVPDQAELDLPTPRAKPVPRPPVRPPRNRPAITSDPALLSKARKARPRGQSAAAVALASTTSTASTGPTGSTPSLPRPRRNDRPLGQRPQSNFGYVHPGSQSAAHPPPRKALGPRVLDVIFKLEVMIVVIVVLVAVGVWAQHQRYDFNRKADASLCRFMGGC